MLETAGKKAARNWARIRQLRTLREKLDVEKMTDEVKRRVSPPRIRGKMPVSKELGIVAFWCSIFEMNELNPSQQKLTDATIKAAMQKHYPHSPGVQSLSTDDPKRRMTVNAFRQLYNAGRLHGKKPERISFRYNAEGRRVDGRTGKRLLTPEDEERLIGEFESAPLRRAVRGSGRIERMKPVVRHH